MLLYGLSNDLHRRSLLAFEVYTPQDRASATAPECVDRQRSGHAEAQNAIPVGVFRESLNLELHAAVLAPAERCLTWCGAESFVEGQ